MFILFSSQRSPSKSFEHLQDGVQEQRDVNPKDPNLAPESLKGLKIWGGGGGQLYAFFSSMVQSFSDFSAAAKRHLVLARDRNKHLMRRI